LSNRRTTNRRNRNRGKAHEREIAKRLAGERRGIMGGVDVDAGMFAVECKSMSKYPGYLLQYYEQAKRHAQPGQIPIVAIHKKNGRYDDDLVMLPLSVWVERILPFIQGEAQPPTMPLADLREIHERLGELLQ